MFRRSKKPTSQQGDNVDKSKRREKIAEKLSVLATQMSDMILMGKDDTPAYRVKQRTAADLNAELDQLLLAPDAPPTNQP